VCQLPLFDLALAGETIRTLDFTLELSHKDAGPITRGIRNSNFSQRSRALGRDALARGHEARCFDKAAIERELVHLRALLCDWVVALPESALSPPMIRTINPPLWEAAHVAWFAEWWCVRDAYNVDDGSTFGGTRTDRESMWANCDGFLNSNVIAHEVRWSLPQITRAATLDFLQRTLDETIARLRASDESDEALYRFRLAMFHEAMHLEALAWCAQTLAWERPAWVLEMSTPLIAKQQSSNTNVLPKISGEKSINSGFQFDNEIGYSPIHFNAMADDVGIVSNAQFLAFVESGEYRKITRREHPIYWRRDEASGWQQRRFSEWINLAPDEPVVHVSAFEAEAFATWADARLPTEDELHVLFNDDATNAWHGDVWEWTSSAFTPPPNFQPGLYREYSAPWFDGKHRVLRGGSFATLDIMHHANYRNFFTPDRSDVFAGFRIHRK
jgi:gamma-glutamyl hercynylcysteine S-oxide synthase